MHISTIHSLLLFRLFGSPCSVSLITRPPVPGRPRLPSIRRNPPATRTFEVIPGSHHVLEASNRKLENVKPSDEGRAAVIELKERGQASRIPTDMKRRADDNAETVEQRLRAYHAQTAPLIDYYDAKGVLARVDAMADIGAVSHELNAIVRKAFV